MLFLLGSFSAQADCPERQRVPSAEHGHANIDAPVVAITRTKILVDGSPAAVDAALTALLTGFGASSSQALAADLVWRAGSFVPQVLLGALTFLWWRVTAAKRRARVAAGNAGGEPRRPGRG